MLVGCGVAPRGSLRLARMAAKLNPTISGGPCMLVSFIHGVDIPVCSASKWGGATACQFKKQKSNAESAFAAE